MPSKKAREKAKEIHQKVFSITPDEIVKQTFNPDSFKDYPFYKHSKLPFILKSDSIPQILHVIFLNKKHVPVELNDAILNTLRSNMQILATWKLFIWTNHYNSTPFIKDFCESQISNCSLKDLSTLTGYHQIQHHVNKLINLNLTPLAEHMLSMNILTDHGGLYTTKDFVFKNSPSILHNYVDFYSSYSSKRKLDPNFIASKAQHPVIIYHAHMMNGFYGIELDVSLPYFTKKIISYNSANQLIGGPISLTTAFYLYKNKGDGPYFILNKNMISEETEASEQITLDGTPTVIPQIGTYPTQNLPNSEQIFLDPKDPLILTINNAPNCNLFMLGNDYPIKLAVQKVLDSAGKITCNNDDPIEYISHRVWLSNPDNPYLLKKEVLRIAEHSIRMLDSDNKPWKHFWWMTKQSHYTDEMRSMFSAANIELRSIDELYSVYPKLEKAIKNSATLSYSLSVDLVKWLVIYHFGGLYMDVDYLVQSVKSLNDLHSCSRVYMPHNNYSIGNAMLAAKKGNAYAEQASNEYMRLLADEINKFSGCSKVDQIMRFNDFAHIKIFAELILSERIDAESFILGHISLFSNKVSDHCLTEHYGNLTISTIGFDYQFHTWNSGSNDINSENMKKFSDSSNIFSESDFCI